MSGSGKKRFLSSHAKSSAMVVSLVIHAVLIIVAFSFVAVKVIIKDDQTFEAKKVNRPRMKLKKLQVPVNVKKRKAPKPKLRKNIVAKAKVKSMDLKMPEIVGIKGGLGGMGDGTGLGFGGLDDLDLFGLSRSYGNELVGTLYDFKLDGDKEPVKMSDKLYFEVLSKFGRSWNENVLDQFFSAPKKKFSNVFYIPTINANAAPEAFGVADIVKPSFWVIYYKGKIKAPKTGKYRFWGYGDDVLLVRIKKRLVLQANWNDRKAIEWSSDDERNKQFKIFRKGGETLFIGDWFSLKKGSEVSMEVLLGECGGGLFAGALMIEQKEGVYAIGEDGRPILPLFKTKKLPDELIEKMNINPHEAKVEGPNFGVLQ